MQIKRNHNIACERSMTMIKILEHDETRYAELCYHVIRNNEKLGEIFL
jgi:hypothetical protein